MRPGTSWLWDDRLAEIWAWPNKAGSGVAFGSGGVLTARHVVADAIENSKRGRILARLVRRGEVTSSWVTMRLVADDREWDLAVLEIDSNAPVSWAEPLSPSPVVAEVGTAVERDCEAVGFPDEDVQDGGSNNPGEAVRQTEQVWGTLLPMGQAKLPIAPQRRLPQRWMPLDAMSGTPKEQAGWGGMSGAGVLLPDGRLIGVVVNAEAAYQQRRLYVVPLSAALDSSERLREALATVVGAPVVKETRNVIGHRLLVRSSYLHQVQRIAPPTLKGRDAELRELSNFCTEPNRNTYVWWQAPAWAGKSALISWFVLHPPAGAQLVSFFVTARYASQGDRTAFSDVVLEQLVEMLGEHMPAYMTDATREAHLLGMLSQAAKACQQRGLRLVLVVDGLDEDQGVTSGSYAHSIAALLPILPPSSMRIVVAGRLDPPLPRDIPDGHPLRDPRVIRLLAPSPYAQVIREDMERELDRLLEGDVAEQDLLGLITAGGGGLSGPDLAELTSMPLRTVHNILHAVSGRTFARRTSTWGKPSAPEVYVLGHEELQRNASAFIGEVRLGEYRERLHTWADRYRRHGWPASTPEYLLRGYFRMLHSAGQVHRMVACATDVTRHDRMLDISGGDIAAITEITATQEVILRQDEPDLLALARLRIAQERLAARNQSIPWALPAVWAALGNAARAEALARSIPDPRWRGYALLQVAEALAEAGDRHSAETVARTIDDKTDRIAALAEAGSYDEAESLARSITLSDERIAALASLAERMVNADPGRANILTAEAENACQGITKPQPGTDSAAQRKYARPLRSTAIALAALGEADRARRLIDSIADWNETRHALDAAAMRVAASGYFTGAEELARSIHKTHRGDTLAKLARQASKAGHRREARRLADTAENIIRSSELRCYQVKPLALVAKAVAVEDRPRALSLINEAEAIALSEIDREINANFTEWSLIDVAEALVDIGDFDRAVTVVRSHIGLSHDREASSRVIDAMADAGEYDRAESFARAEDFIPRRLDSLTQVARALANVAPDRARALANEIETVARRMNPGRSGGPEMAVALISIGEYDGAEILARSAGGANDVTLALAVAGEYDRAEAFVRSAKVSIDTQAKMAALAGDYDLAETLARSIRGQWEKDRTLLFIVELAARARQYNIAVTIARSIYDKDKRARALAVVAGELARGDDLDRALSVVSEAERIAFEGDEITLSTVVEVAGATAMAGNYDQADEIVRRLPPFWDAEALVAVVKAMAERGDLDEAETTARSITDNEEKRVHALCAVAVALTGTGNGDRAQSLAKEAGNLAQSIEFQIAKDEALAAAASTAAKLGERDRAEVLIRSISNPGKKAKELTNLTRKVDATHARRLVAEAFCIGPWTTLLQVLGDVEPDALKAVADDLSAARRLG